MKRTLIAAAWIAGSTVPLVLAAVFHFGCCVLPFHHVLHRLMPLCAMAQHHPNDEGTSTPARTKQEPVKVFTEVPKRFVLAPAEEPRIATRTATRSHRSIITLGATRCDRDVGWHVVIETFLI